jgi:cyclophilin family peptidyl-prolyl cis-trans isomerase
MATARIRAGLLAGCVATASVAGCGKPAVSEQAPPIQNPASTENQPDSTIAAKPALINYHEGFDDAVITDVLDGHHLPPDMTIAGAKTGPLRALIERTWPAVSLTDDAGRPRQPIVRFETAEGPVEIKLRPEWAPNHVRNLMTLAQVGYYDGLFIERNVRQEADVDGQKSRLDLLIAGCPTGTGEDGFGHLGYFVRAEFQPELKHEAGTVGFWHEEDPDSAGVRFYITLGPAPALDGKFTIVGNVTTGLETLRRVASHPTRSSDPASPDSDRPVRPVGIRKASVSIAPGEK